MAERIIKREKKEEKNALTSVLPHCGDPHPPATYGPVLLDLEGDGGGPECGGEAPGIKRCEEGGAGEARAEHLERGRTYPGQLRLLRAHLERRIPGRDLSPDAPLRFLRCLLHQVLPHFSFPIPLFELLLVFI